MFRFVTNRTQPHDLQGFGIVGVVSMWLAWFSALRAPIGADYFSVFNRLRKKDSRSMFYVLAILLGVLSVILCSVFLTPLSACLSYPFTLFVFVLSYVASVSLVNLLCISFAISFLLFTDFRTMLRTVDAIVFLAFLWVFERHTTYCAMTATLRQMNLEAY